MQTGQETASFIIYSASTRSTTKEDAMPLLVPPVADERDGLLTFLSAQRDALRASVFGLDREQATSQPSVSALSLAGLIKHAALTERGWVSERIAQRTHDGVDYKDTFKLRDDETVEDVLALYDEVAAETEEIVNTLPDLDHQVPVPKGVPWFPDDLDFWSARWVLLHCIQETARHAGHADIVRESIDGSNAFVLLAKWEGDVPDFLAAYES